MGGSVSASLYWLGVAGCQVQEGLLDSVAVELQGFVLVVEAHQALVAGGLAGGLSVVALVVEVAALQGFSCGSCDSFGLFDEAEEDSGSSFGGFVEEIGELGFFELEELLAASL